MDYLIGGGKGLLASLNPLESSSTGECRFLSLLRYQILRHQINKQIRNSTTVTVLVLHLGDTEGIAIFRAGSA